MHFENLAIAGRVKANDQALSRVISVLLDNAIKYSPDKSVVRIQAEIRGKHYLLRIKDQGPGINAKDLPHIFQRFYRADPSRTKTTQGGYGLGLAIADKLVRQMGGKISVTSKPRKGSSFTVNLPLSKAGN